MLRALPPLPGGARPTPYFLPSQPTGDRWGGSPRHTPRLAQVST